MELRRAMLKPMAQLHCGCCFIVPPDLLRELSRGQKVPPADPRAFQYSFLEQCGCDKCVKVIVQPR
jgi:hypothetical protein